MQNIIKSIINNIALRYLYIKLALQTRKAIKNYQPDHAIGTYIEDPTRYTPISLAIACLLTKKEK